MPNDFGKVSSSQLHHFPDASQHAYGTVTYLHVTNPEGDVHCCFVIGESLCCFKPNDFGKVSSSQLHHFPDASQHAYGTVTYLRVTNPEGDVHCSFVIGESRLSLLKHLTIPHLELSAAMVALAYQSASLSSGQTAPAFWVTLPTKTNSFILS